MTIVSSSNLRQGGKLEADCCAFVGFALDCDCATVQIHNRLDDTSYSLRQLGTSARKQDKSDPTPPNWQGHCGTQHLVRFEDIPHPADRTNQFLCEGIIHFAP
jgi:hypothetical protein